MGPNATSTPRGPGTAASTVLRWLSVVPAVALVSAIAYGVASSTNSLEVDPLSEFVIVVVFAGAGYTAVFIARMLAPVAKRGAGVAVAVMIALASCYAIGDRITLFRPEPSHSAVWYNIVLHVVLTLGALVGALSGGDDEEVAPNRLDSTVAA